MRQIQRVMGPAGPRGPRGFPGPAGGPMGPAGPQGDRGPAGAPADMSNTVSINAHAISLKELIDAAGSDKRTIIISSALQMGAAAITVPANVDLQFISDGCITIDASQVLTIRGGVYAGHQQIFVQEDTTARVKFLQNAPSILPQWFGAKGDGSTDDTDAITRAFSSLSYGPEDENGHGGELYFPSGVYCFTSLDFSFDWTKDHYRPRVLIRGAGMGTPSPCETATTVLRCTGSGDAILLQRAEVSELRLETATAERGLVFTINKDCYVHDVAIHGFSVSGFYGSGFTGVLERVTIIGCATGIYLTGNMVDVRNCIIYAWTVSGITLDRCVVVNILGCDIEGGEGPAVLSTVNASKLVAINGCYFENMTSDSDTGYIRAMVGEGGGLANASIENNYFNVNSKEHVYAIYADQIVASVIRNNYVVGALGASYYLKGDWSGKCWLNSLEDANIGTPVAGSSFYARTRGKRPRGVEAGVNHYIRGGILFDPHGWYHNGSDPDVVPESEIHAIDGVNDDYMTVVTMDNNGNTKGSRIIGRGSGASQEIGAITFERSDSVGSTRLWAEAGSYDLEDVVDARVSGVRIGDGAWNGTPLKLGGYYLWVDASGNLRIKSSAPTGDTDGAVVGAQT